MNNQKIAILQYTFHCTVKNHINKIKINNIDNNIVNSTFALNSLISLYPFVDTNLLSIKVKVMGSNPKSKGVKIENDVNNELMKTSGNISFVHV